MKETAKRSRNTVAWMAFFLLLASSCNSKEGEGGNAPFLRFEGPTNLSVSEEGTMQDYSVKSNGQWEVIRKSVQTWATANPASGQNDGSFRLTVGENTSKDNRSLSFSFLLNGDELQDKITVEQAGNPNAENGNDDDEDEEGRPLYTVARIWNAGPHNAFTDLIEYNGKYYCAFREAGAHVPSNSDQDGKIRILVSTDGAVWETAALIARTGYDLRDPKLSVTPLGRIMVSIHGSVYNNGQYMSATEFVAFSEDNEATSFTDLQVITLNASEGRGWLWRVTWNYKTGNGYGVTYTGGNVYLFTTTNGILYTLVTRLNVPAGSHNESTVEILENGQMRIIVRNESGNGYIGYSGQDFTDWTWFDLGIRLGGPDIMTLPNGETIIGTRSFRENRTYTSLYGLDRNYKAVHLLEFPSGGDTSYTGLLVVKNELWVSFYSSHEGKSSIYFAKVRYRQLFN